MGVLIILDSSFLPLMFKGLLMNIASGSFRPNRFSQIHVIQGLWKTMWRKEQTRTRPSSPVRICLSKLVSHIHVFYVSSRTSWHVQIQSSLQLVQIQVFISCLLSIKSTGKPAVGFWRDSLSYCQRFGILRRSPHSSLLRVFFVIYFFLSLSPYFHTD